MLALFQAENATIITVSRSYREPICFDTENNIKQSAVFEVHSFSFPSLQFVDIELCPRIGLGGAMDARSAYYATGEIFKGSKRAEGAAFDAMRRTLVVLIVLVSACARWSASDTTKERAVMNLSDVRHISVAINRSPREVYDFASKPENLPRWARGLAGSIENVGGEWIAKSPMGR